MDIRKIEFQSPEYYQALALRDAVLRAPLNLFFSGEDIRAEASYTHFGAFQNSKIIATAQWVQVGNNTFKMRQVAVDFSHQGKGIGAQLIDYLENWAQNQNAHLLELHARETAVPFYLKKAYQIKGDAFLEVGIPHYYMFKPFSS